MIVSQGLDLQIVVVRGDLAQVFKGLPIHDSPEQLAGLARAAHQKPFPVLVQQAFGRAGSAVESSPDAPGGDEPVQVLQPGVVFHQQGSCGTPASFLGSPPCQGAVDLVHPLDPLAACAAAPGSLGKISPSTAASSSARWWWNGFQLSSNWPRNPGWPFSGPAAGTGPWSPYRW